MAQYAILIFDNAAAGDYTLDQQAASKRHADELIDSGAMITAYALQSADTAASLRGDVVTDGAPPATSCPDRRPGLTALPARGPGAVHQSGAPQSRRRRSDPRAAVFADMKDTRILV
ncbi:hypothetical protein ABZ468_54615 [Streptomyces sp. NPDC005708]|uniref:hypothetical protein n=1 Tax=Streptomyces sp. NPDC005708 TaxID=3154564 RepID=UPI00340695DF